MNSKRVWRQRRVTSWLHRWPGENAGDSKSSPASCSRHCPVGLPCRRWPSNWLPQCECRPGWRWRAEWWQWTEIEGRPIQSHAPRMQVNPKGQNTYELIDTDEHSRQTDMLGPNRRLQQIHQTLHTSWLCLLGQQHCPPVPGCTRNFLSFFHGYYLTSTACRKEKFTVKVALWLFNQYNGKLLSCSRFLFCFACKVYSAARE